MYGVMDSNGDLIAFHEEKRVIKKYMEDYFHTNNEHLLPFHIKKKTAFLPFSDRFAGFYIFYSPLYAYYRRIIGVLAGSNETNPLKRKSL